MKLVVTGGSGALAQRAAQFVLAAGVPPHDLILATRTPARVASFAARGVTVRPADFAAPETLPSAFAGGERLLLVSGTDLAERTAQHTAAIAAAKEAGVPHVIYTSGLRSEPANPALVASSHYETERVLVRSGLAWTVLRMGLYADYQVAEAERALASGVLVHNRGSGTVAYVAREDCAAVAAAVLCERGHASATYDVTGAEAFTAADLAALYAEVGGKPVVTRELDDAAFMASMVGAGGGDDHLRYGAALVTSFGRAIREGYMSARSDTVSKLTGRAPRALRDVLAPLRAASR